MKPLDLRSGKEQMVKLMDLSLGLARGALSLAPENILKNRTPT